MTTLLLHQPLTIGVHSTYNKPKIWANHYRSWVSVTFLEAMRRLSHDVWLVLKETSLIKKVNISSFKLQQACEAI
jgi:hypothetical protein